MATWWIDYSAAKLPAATILSTAVGPAGEHPSGVIRYIDEPKRLRTKHTSGTEFADHRGAGLGQALFFEDDVDDPLGGYAGGQANARRALAGAEYLGYRGPIFLCCDRWFATKGRRTIHPDVWRSYLDGAASILGAARVGAYGFADAMDAALGHASYFIQCGARSAVRGFVHGWQDNTKQPYVGGIQTDRILIVKPLTALPGDSQPGAPTTSKGIELMERKTIAPSPDTTAVRLLLPGSPGAAIIIRPRIDASGTAVNPVWLGNIYAWGSDKAGIGHNPKTEPGFNPKLTTHHRHELPGAVWADLEYSSVDAFEVDIVG